MAIGIEDNVEDAIRDTRRNLKSILERGYVLTRQAMPFGEHFYRKGNSMIIYNYERDEIVSEYELKGHKIFRGASDGLHTDEEGKFYLSGSDLKLDRDGLAELIKKGDVTLEIPKEVIEYFQNMSEKSKLENIGNH